MKKLFKVYLRNYKFLPIVNLADYKNIDLIDDDFTKNVAKLYFFVKSNCYLDNVSINEFTVSGQVFNNRKNHFLRNVPNCLRRKHKFSFEIPNFLESLLINIYKDNKNDIQSFLKEEPTAKNILDYILSSLNINRASYTQKNLTNNTSLFKYREPIFGYKEQPPVHIYQLINAGLVSIPSKYMDTHILYIGKSDNVNGILKGRILGHEKMLPILGEMGTYNDEILVFMFEIFLDSVDSQNVPKDIFIPCVEELLIRYFNPPKNIEYVSTKLGQTKHIKKLIELGFENYLVELNFDDQVCNFGTQSIPYSQKHIILGKLSEIGTHI
ncbi:hypothetical protein [Haemophilus haemolyticus]|uniref:hypothetical protein n=1 Tax=Haemophilus haemolyticus TaxID=726 RepID=UPI000E57EBE1|nr:hypothetical protein [Haemophilus haemolyticus]